jgi:hypothetical protein
MSLLQNPDSPSRAENCREKAEQCRQLAGTALTASTRDSFLQLARSYEHLAKELQPKRQQVVPSQAASFDR